MISRDELNPGFLRGLLPDIGTTIRKTLPDSSIHRSLEDHVPFTFGIPDGAKAATIAVLAKEFSGPILVITPRHENALSIGEEIQNWLIPSERKSESHKIISFPCRDLIPYEYRRSNPITTFKRLETLVSLSVGNNPLIITDIQAISQGTYPAPITLSRFYTGQTLDLSVFISTLFNYGYQSVVTVYDPGTFAQRGGIIDIFSIQASKPVRIELLGNEIGSMRQFDPQSQRSIKEIDVFNLSVATESQIDKHGKKLARNFSDHLAQQNIQNLNQEEEATNFERSLQFTDVFHNEIRQDVLSIEEGTLPENLSFWTPFLTRETLAEHLPKNTLIIWDEIELSRKRLMELDELGERTRKTLEHRGDVPKGIPLPHMKSADLFAKFNQFSSTIELNRFAQEDENHKTNKSTSKPVNALTVHRPGFGPVSSYGGRMQALINDLRKFQENGDQIVLISQQAPRLSELLIEHGIPICKTEKIDTRPEAGVVTIIHGSVRNGWKLPLFQHNKPPSTQLKILTDTEVFGFTKERRYRKSIGRKTKTFLENIAIGDLVVHIEHGIGKYTGTGNQRVGDREREYVELRYADSDRLLVPTDQLHRLQRYIGSSDHKPTLTRLGSQQWQRAKQRTQKSILGLAEDLLDLYASRSLRPGIASPEDSPWQMELEAAFPYSETPDQIEAMQDVKDDMESTRPMDRILVGDVGYGKTELAIRAAFKAVMAGSQVLMLVPTTILAQQHFTTFKNRMTPFPVRIEMLSRFRSKSQQKEILSELQSGNIDIIIGTHRLLQSDVQAKSLGLLIIDEEQRFGVTHKEKLKRLRAEVDVLTLSATPIPRTMHMALTGIRDMSMIETPPEQRLPITTYVTTADDDVMRNAILREIERGGQVYFVHNRIQSIGIVERRLRELVPKGKFLVGHGQMPEDELEQVMMTFVSGEADVLICTTIIESGLDIPNVNTIIINQAHRFGLAQLYQLRGRVGRSTDQSYAYLLYDQNMALNETAQQRLQTIFDSTELGAGLQIALRDLEIRGTGNLLGAAQSGHIGAVGFELYTQLLAETVERLRAIKEGRPEKFPKKGPTVTVDLPLTAHIPKSYIDDVNLRLSMYQKLSAIEQLEEVDKIATDFRDQFGALPKPLVTLLQIVRVRTLASRLGAKVVQSEEEAIAVRLVESRSFKGIASKVEVPDGVHIGNRLMKIDRRKHRETWLTVLESLLARLTGIASSDTQQNGPHYTS